MRSRNPNPRRRFHSASLWMVCLAVLLTFSQVKAQESTPAAPKPGTTIHVVQRGENLYRIALLYGTTVEDIARANGISNTTMISVGQRLLIPNALNIPNSAPGVPTDYTVGPGDSLLDLAWRYGTTVDLIARQNKIVNPAVLYIGLPLSLQVNGEGHPLIQNGYIYTVQSGDTLYRIAMRYSQPMAAIMQANELDRANVLFEGQRLVIPTDSSGPSLMDLSLPFTQLTMQPAIAEQGRTLEFSLTTLNSAQISGTFMGKPILDRSEDNGLTHHILIGVGAFTLPGIYSLALSATEANGTKTDLTRSLAIKDGAYNSEKIQLPPDQADLLDPKVTQPELDRLMAIVSKVSAKRYWNGPMGLPVPAAITSQYGTRRSYNNGPYDQFHTGTDFAGPPNAPIYAPAAGVVVFTDLLHVRGNATIIDHGWGVFTGYWHQTQILVKVGDVVQQGQIIGKIGSTGRVTGPHLHWEMFINGVQVDPTQWARATFP